MRVRNVSVYTDHLVYSGPPYRIKGSENLGGSVYFNRQSYVPDHRSSRAQFIPRVPDRGTIADLSISRAEGNTNRRFQPRTSV